MTLALTMPQTATNTTSSAPADTTQRQRAPFTSPGSFQDLAINAISASSLGGGASGGLMPNGGVRPSGVPNGIGVKGLNGHLVGAGSGKEPILSSHQQQQQAVWGLTMEGSRGNSLDLDGSGLLKENGYGYSLSDPNADTDVGGVEYLHSNKYPPGGRSGTMGVSAGGASTTKARSPSDRSSRGYFPETNGHANGVESSQSIPSPNDYRNRDRGRDKSMEVDVVDLASRQASMAHATSTSRSPASGNGTSSSNPFSYTSTINHSHINTKNTSTLHHRRAGSVTDSLLKTLIVSPRSLIPTPSTIKFCLLCVLWYASSAFSSNTGKVILNNFRFPVTLTIVQFWFVAAYCWAFTSGRRRLSVLLGRTGITGLGYTARHARRALSSGAFGVDGGAGTAGGGGGGWAGSTLRSPTKAILRNTWPIATFQVGGHIFSSMAISRVPVSTVHTIKALSPLFTVCAYALLFKVSYSPATYLSLLPLTLGVMLACSFDLSAGNIFGLVCAFGSTIVFVSSNIVFKKLMPSATGEKTGLSSTAANGGSKLDKVNLLFFSSGLAFVFMIPLWAYSDMPTLISMWRDPTSALAVAARANVKVSSGPPPSIPLYFFLNCTVHFGQNLLAFSILSSVSPVTYSIASLVKRIAVICLAIVWFKQKVHPIQGFGIALTGLGLYMYNNAKRDVDKSEKKVRQMEAQRDGILPMTKADQRLLDGRADSPPPFDSGLHGEKSSPKPMYDGLFTGRESISVSSSIKTGGYNPAGFQLPAQAYPQLNVAAGPPRGRPYQQNLQAGYVGAYPTNADALPSPPPSNANSPPFTAAPPHIIDSAGPTSSARRRMSVDATRPNVFAPSQHVVAGVPSTLDESEETTSRG